MYPPTFHPGVYDKPERAPYLDIGNLFKLLFHPKEAFEDLYDHTTSTQGIILAVFFSVMSTGVGLLATWGILGTLDLPPGADIPLLVETNAVMAIVGIFTSIASFFLTAWLFHAFIKGNARRPSLPKTMGMMGYAMFPAFIIMLIINITFPLIMVGANFDEADAFFGAICGIFALIFGLGLVGLIWAWWVHSNAQSVANDISTNTAFGYLFLTWFLVGILMGIVGFVISMAVLGTTLGF
jgi:hypothetical protein